MNTVFLASDREYMLAAMRRALPEGCTAVCVNTPEEVISYTSLDADIALVDITSRRSEHISIISQLKKLMPNCAVIAVLPSEKREGEELVTDMCYETVRVPIDIADLRISVLRVIERSRLLREITHLKANLHEKRDIELPHAQIAHSDSRFNGVLRKFAKGLGAGFNRERLIKFIHEAIDELNPVSRVSIILAEPGGEYTVASSRGLHPDVLDSLYLSPGRGLLLWLSQQGRVLRKSEAGYSGDPLLLDAVREMDVLQAVVSIPSIGKGRLLGSINLGEKVIGGQYSNEELEMLYILASNIAVALEDIDIFNELQHQKSYIEDILLRMNSGVITIDASDRITIFNHRAAETLDIQAERVIGGDLRNLPSPLGDMLHESLVTGRKRNQHQIKLAGKRDCYLEISTFQLRDALSSVRGAVLIFDDISTERALQREKENAQRLEMLNRVVALLAHELRNPLVSVNTFIELFPERKNDEDFNSGFYEAVCKDVHRLDDLLDKLITLSKQSDYDFESTDVSSLLKERIKKLETPAREAGISIKPSMGAASVRLSLDRKQMGKAIEYIIHNSINSTRSGGVVSVSIDDGADGDYVRISVNDDGDPLPANSVDDVFRPFFVSDGRGADIGLAVAHRIVHDHGGNLIINGNDRARFEVVLPVNSDRGENHE
ncbi:MAG: histidine kinase dimerization/phospho-acceptor domain-containing protein [bacterium]|nr:histidine kinase dimerization/phospho-acceptor domain-containing protein [bacterium]